MLDKFLNQVEKSNIMDMVFDMNRIFGTETISTSRGDLTPLIHTQLKNIADELHELVCAIELDVIQRDDIGSRLYQAAKKNLEDGGLNQDHNGEDEIFDALGDILTFALGGMYILDINKLQDESIATTPDREFLYDEAKRLHDHLHDIYGVIELDMIGKLFNHVCNFAIKWSHAFNYDIEKLMKAVTRSNYTKLMFTDDEINKTVDKYVSVGVEVYVRNYSSTIGNDIIEYSVIYSSKDQTDKNGKVYRKDKFLKGINFKNPEL